MRPDIAKVTTERERNGSRNPNRKFGGKVPVARTEDDTYDKEKGGFHASTRGTYSRNWDESKSFTDRLNVIKGNLRVNVGRPWRLVYAEFAKNLDRRSNAGIHIFGHMKDFVETNTFLEGNKVMYVPRWGHNALEVEGYYVHPETGLLCYKEEINWRTQHKRDRKPKEITELAIEGSEEFYTKDAESGLWYRSKYILMDLWSYSSYKGLKTTYYRPTKVLKRIKSCNKKELALIQEYIDQQAKIQRRKAK